jgi:hypothetical protein
VFRHAIAEGPSSIVHCCNGSRHVCRRPVSIGPSGITRIGSAELAARLCAPAAPWDVSIVWRPTRFPNSRCSGGALGECACRCACMSAHMRMYAGARAREFARGWRMLRVRGSARTQNHRSLDGLAEVLEVYPPWCCKRISEQLRVPVQWSMSLCRLGGRKLRGMANHVRTCSRAAPPPRGTCEWRWRAIKVSPRGHPAPASQTIRLSRDQNEDACQPGM